MAGRGNEIVVSAEPNGRFIEGTIKAAETPKPGTILQIDSSAGIDSLGRFVWEIFNSSADGVHPLGPFIILREDIGQGKTNTDAYAAGDHAYGYIPLHGDELNLVISDVSGTADIALGTVMMVDDGTGELIATTGVEAEVFLLMELISAPAADELGFGIWCY